MKLTIEGGIKNEKEKKVKKLGAASVILFGNYSRYYSTINILRGDNMTFKEESRLFRELSKHRARCKCSHSVYIGRLDRTLCSYCGEWVYRTPEIRFKYEIEKYLKKERKNDNEIRQTRQTCNT